VAGVQQLGEHTGQRTQIVEHLPESFDSSSQCVVDSEICVLGYEIEF
jgi:hypothetical protein